MSGLEHLEILFNRSELAKVESALNREQQKRLAIADQQLLRQAQQFYQAIQAIANLQSWRAHKQEPPEHWWWYLDVLAAAPVVPERVAEPVPA